MAPTVALAGNPNSGKTTLFNGLTGARQHVGNYPGVTVDKKEGFYLRNGFKLHIVDLPGTYSLTAYSVEEVVARDFLVNEKPRVIVNIVDASNLERNLYLSLQFLELGVPVCIALNMIDLAESRGIRIHHQKLSQLLNVPVVPIIARTGKGQETLMETVARMAEENRPWVPLHISYGEDIDQALLELSHWIEGAGFMTDTYPARWTAVKYMEGDEQILAKGAAIDPVLSQKLQKRVEEVSDHLERTMETYPEALIADHRYGYIKSVMKQDVIRQEDDLNRLYTSDRIDKVLTHRFIGPLIMLLVLMGLYHFTFTYSEIPVGWVEQLFAWMGWMVDQNLADGYLKSLLISGVIDGVGGVLGFAPLIMLMFFGIAVLEDSGYLARVAFMLDRVFRVFGLHGSSVMAYIIAGGIAGGCAVPGIMAARTLRSPRERLATLLTAPFMNCGAKLPIFALLIAAFFAQKEAVLMFAFTLLAWLGALLVAKLLRVTVIRGPATPFVMELPPYRFPTFRGLVIHTWERTWQYIKKAGTVILAISVLLWTMMSFPELPDSRRDAFESQRQALMGQADESVKAQLKDATASLSPAAEALKADLNRIEARQGKAALRYSVAGRIGTALEGISQWAGFDWRTNIALIGGFAAKEVVVSTLGTAYSLGETDPEANISLSKRLANSPQWRPLKALALIVFTIFYAPCFVAVVCIAKESGSWKWGLFSMVFNTVLAFVLATAVYQIGSLLGY